MDKALRLMARITPTKRVLLAVHRSGRTYLACSDPYLSTAQPLADVAARVDQASEPAFWRGLAAEHDAVACIVASAVYDDEDPPGAPPRAVVQAMRDAPLEVETLGHLRLRKRDVGTWRRCNPELWDGLQDIDLDNPTPDATAAVALTHLIESYSGGWSNTFG